MKSRMFNALKMDSQAKKPIVQNSRLRLMSTKASRPRRIKRKIVLMENVNKADGLSLAITSKLKRGRRLHMDAFTGVKNLKLPKTFAAQEELKTKEILNVAHHIQLRMKVINGNVEVVGARKVDGGFVKESKLHLNEGLVYEITKGRRRLQFGVIPDFGEERGFPSPNPKNEAEKGHAVSQLKEFDFNVRVLPNDLSLATLKAVKVNLYRAKSAISSIKVTDVSLEKQFAGKLRKMASMQRITITKLPKALQNNFKKALK
jgi:hypothetical protein